MRVFFVVDETLDDCESLPHETVRAAMAMGHDVWLVYTGPLRGNGAPLIAALSDLALFNGRLIATPDMGVLDGSLAAISGASARALRGFTGLVWHIQTNGANELLSYLRVEADREAKEERGGAETW